MYNTAHSLDAGSPYTFIVKGPNPPDPSKVSVTGPGVEHGILANFESRFFVDTEGAGAGNLSVKMRGPKGQSIALHYPLSTKYYPLSTTHYPLPTVHYPLSSTLYPLRTIRYPLFTTHYPLSTIHSPLFTIHYHRPDLMCDE